MNLETKLNLILPNKINSVPFYIFQFIIITNILVAMIFNYKLFFKNYIKHFTYLQFYKQNY